MMMTDNKSLLQPMASIEIDEADVRRLIQSESEEEDWEDDDWEDDDDDD